MVSDEFWADFTAWTSEIVCCSVATVDEQGSPRQRMLHPVWTFEDGVPVGYVVTSQTPVKTRHLAANPQVACMYWSPVGNVVTIDAVAGWVKDGQPKQEVYDLFNSTPPPVGYNLDGFLPEGSAHPLFNPLRLDAWRVQLLSDAQVKALDLKPRTWRK